MAPSSLSRVFAWRNRLALLVIAVLATASYGAQLILLDPAKADGSAINLAGRQRMLSQRVALHVTVLGRDDLADTARKNREQHLEQDIRAMGAAQTTLAPSPSHAALTDELRAHYFRAPADVARRTQEYLDLATGVLEESRREGFVGEEAVTAVLERSATILPQLHRGVGLFELANEERLTALARALGALFLAMIGALVLMWSAVLRPATKHLAAREQAQREEDEERAAREAEERYASELQAGMEILDSEDDVMRLLGRAFGQIEAPLETELLLADSSQAHLRRAVASEVGARGCSVETPFDCPAVRNARPMTFSSSRALDACPRLVDREAPA